MEVERKEKISEDWMRKWEGRKDVRRKEDIKVGRQRH